MGTIVDESIILNLIDQIYDAVGNAELWPAFLEKFADVVGGTTTQMIIYDVERKSGNLSVAVRSGSEFQKKYNEYYIGIDCYAAYGRKQILTGNVVTGQMLCPDSILSKTEFYNDFMRTEGIFHQFCGFICQEQSVTSVISVLRPERMGPFGEDHIRLLRVLMPHLQRAVQIHRRIAGLEQKASATEDVLDRIPIGYLMVDATGKVLMSNRRARAVLEQDDGLTLSRDLLTASRAEETARLRDLIRAATVTGKAKGLASGGVMTIARPSLRRPFQVMVAPLRPGDRLLWPETPAAAVFLSDPETVPEGKELILARLFGFTAAEARLAASLMHGSSLEESAEEFHLSRCTVRTQLQRLFDKTGSRRQGELIQLLWNSLAQLRFDSE